MFNDLSSPLSYLKSRRSARPRDMVEPGPDAGQLHDILAMATRTPDHGKLAPWRFVTVAKQQRGDFADLLKKAFVKDNPDARPAQIEAATAMAHMAPSLVILIHSPQESQKIPAWEQELSTGAAGMNLLHAAHAHGFVGGWITGWPSTDQNVHAALCKGQEKIAGFFYFGTAGGELIERERPEPAAKISAFNARPE